MADMNGDLHGERGQNRLCAGFPDRWGGGWETASQQLPNKPPRPSVPGGTLGIPPELSSAVVGLCMRGLCGGEQGCQAARVHPFP